MECVKDGFYSYFRRDIQIYPEAEEALAKIKKRKLLTGTRSDIAYGMDNTYALEDIKLLLRYIDFPYTSNDTGCRKPCGKALEILAAKMKMFPVEMIFVGDEKKDIECAKNAGAKAVLINRTNEQKEYGQDLEIKSLAELITYIT